MSRLNVLPRPSEFQGSHLLAGPSSPMLIRDRFHCLREIRIRKEANVGISNAYFERARGSPVIPRFRSRDVRRLLIHVHRGSMFKDYW